jgi:hypothetical protein
MEFKKCTGYRGHHACDYPDNMVPVSEFGSSINSSDGLQGMCSVCKNYYNKYFNNVRISAAIKFVGGRDKLRAMTKEERTKIYAIVDAVKWKIVVTDSKQFKFDDEVRYSTQKEQIKRTRDSKVVSYIRSVYDLCSVVGCDYSEYDVAHIHALKHGSDDVPSNCLALCPNHHRDLDRGKMVLTLFKSSGIIQFVGDEIGIIRLKHEVESRYIDQCNLELEEWKNEINKVQSKNDRSSLAMGK